MSEEEPNPSESQDHRFTRKLRLSKSRFSVPGKEAAHLPPLTFEQRRKQQEFVKGVIGEMTSLGTSPDLRQLPLDKPSTGNILNN